MYAIFEDGSRQYRVSVGDIVRIDHREAMERFGVDRPDLRFGVELMDLADLAAQAEFKVFQQALAAVTPSPPSPRSPLPPSRTNR